MTDVKLKISALDRTRGVFKKLDNRLGRISRSTSALRRSLGATVSSLTPIGVSAGAVFAGVGLQAKSVVDTASTFETLKATLETIEGSSGKAQRSLDWVADFTKKTPFQLDQVADSFVKLRAYGLEPMENNLLETLGDTASAMGKPVMQAVEAIADAMTGENERLKEFGIKAKSQGEQFIYEFARNGETVRYAADKNNRALIQSTLQAIWNEKFSGAMDKRSKTFGGMFSNFQDRMTDFKLRVASGGLFEGIKSRLSDLLQSFNRWEQNGTLDRWANAIGGTLAKAFDVLADKIAMIDIDAAIEGFEGFLKTSKKIYDAIGGLEGVFYGFAAYIGVGFIANLAAAGSAFLGLAKTMGAFKIASAFLVAGSPLLLGLAALAGALGVIMEFDRESKPEHAKNDWSPADIFTTSRDFWNKQLEIFGVKDQSKPIEQRTQVDVNIRGLPAGSTVDTKGNANLKLDTGRMMP